MAAEAVALVHVDTARAKDAARLALDGARATGDLHAAIEAERAMGLALREEGALSPSIACFRRAIALASTAGSPSLAADARLGLMAAHAIGGQWRRAVREGNLAIAELRGRDRAKVEVQLATVLRLQGRFDEALALYQRALPALRNGEDATLARLHHNRGGIHYHRGAFAAAAADFDRAAELHTTGGRLRLAAQSRQSWGVVMARVGDLPGALEAFARSDELLGGQAAPDPMMLRDRAVALLAASLVREAQEYLHAAVAYLVDAGQPGYLAEVRFFLAEAALRANQPEGARAAAELARKGFARQQRRLWAVLARGLEVRAAWSAGERSPALLAAARRAAAGLAAAGLPIQAADARLVAGRLALELGHVGIAKRELEVTTRARRRGPVDLRTRAWYAEALLRLQNGDRRGARSALKAGMNVLDRYRAALSATDLRVHAAGHGEELAELGTQLALEDGDAGRVLAWSERCRAVSLRLRPVRPPQDAALAADLAAIRRVVSEVQEAALAGRTTSRLLAQQATLEERVRDRARHATGLHAIGSISPPSRKVLAQALGARVLVELVEHRGTLHAVVLKDGDHRLIELGPSGEVQAEVDSVQFSLRRLAYGRGSPASLDAAADAVSFGLKRLDDLLLAPVALDVGDRDVVVVPTARLHAVPWGVLPSMGWRPVAVAPSASAWHEAFTGPPPPAEPNVILVAGPGLPHAVGEITALARRHPVAHVLVGDAATSDAVCAALDGATLAHVAGHGHVRSDNPLFSSLQLADGPVTVYDLEAVPRPPRTLVLSACESGVSDVGPGDELMGLAASLLALGTRTVVASICPVPDDATRRLMLELHRRLAAGGGPAAALAFAQERLLQGGPRDVAAAVGFLCLGAGDS